MVDLKVAPDQHHKLLEREIETPDRHLAREGGYRAVFVTPILANALCKKRIFRRCIEELQRAVAYHHSRQDNIHLPHILFHTSLLAPDELPLLAERNLERHLQSALQVVVGSAAERNLNRVTLCRGYRYASDK